MARRLRAGARRPGQAWCTCGVGERPIVEVCQCQVHRAEHRLGRAPAERVDQCLAVALSDGDGERLRAVRRAARAPPAFAGRTDAIEAVKDAFGGAHGRIPRRTHAAQRGPGWPSRQSAHLSVVSRFQRVSSRARLRTRRISASTRENLLLDRRRESGRFGSICMV